MVEISGAFGTEALDLFAEIGRWVHTVTQDVRAQAFLLQQVSVALQHDNAAFILPFASFHLYYVYAYAVSRSLSSKITILYKYFG